MIDTVRLKGLFAGILLSLAFVLAFAGVASAAPPANDNFVNAQALSGLPAQSTFVNNTDATRETNEPELNVSAGGRSVWYSWTAPGDGRVLFTTQGSGFDTLLGVYTGNDFSSPLVLEGFNDDEAGSAATYSTVPLEVTQGTTYRIVVDGFGPSVGNVDLSVTEPGGVTGTVVVDGTVDPIEDVCVSLRLQNGNNIRQATTDASGDYEITDAVPGNYKLYFEDCNGQNNVLPEYYENQSNFEGANVVNVGSGSPLTLDAAMILGGDISGNVTDEAGDPVQNICINVYGANTNIAGTATTSASGDYRVENLVPGDYRALAFPCGGQDLVNEYFDNARTLATATLIPVTAGQDSADTNFVLSQAGTVSGTITNAQDEPLGGICVYLLRPGGGEESYTQTDENGEYTTGGAAPGQYVIRYEDCSGSGYLDEFYDDAAARADADPVTVASGTDTPGIDAELALGGSITGTVTDTAGDPARTCLDLFDQGGTQIGDESTDPDGEYTFNGLVSGQYRILFYDCFDDGYLREYYDDSKSLSQATPIDVTVGAVTEDIDASLISGGSITGRVTDDSGESLEDYCVQALDEDGHEAGASDTDAEGEYAIRGLLTGTYRVKFSNCGNGSFAGEFYNDKLSLSTADPIEVTLGEENANIDATLVRGGTISGQVTDSSGDPLSGVCVDAYDSDGEYVVGAYAAGGGWYTIEGLSTGEYRVRFADCNDNNVATEYYDDEATLAAATPVSVTAGQDVEDINAELADGGSFSGTVTDEDGDPVSNVCITAYDSNGEATGFGFSDFSGEYQVDGLGTGAHRAYFFSCGGDQLQFEYFDDKPDLDTANTFNIAAGDITEGIDAEMGPDVTPPDTVIDSGPSGQTVNSDRATFTFSATPNEDLDYFECRIDSGDYQRCLSPKTFRDLSEGPHTVEIRAVDWWGQADPTPATATFTVTFTPTGPTGPTSPTGPTGPTTPTGPTGPTAGCLAAQGSLKSATLRLRKSIRLKKGAVKGKKVAAKSLRKAKKSGKRAKVKKAQRKLKRKSKAVKKANPRVRKSRAAVRSAKSAVAASCG